MNSVEFPERNLGLRHEIDAEQILNKYGSYQSRSKIKFYYVFHSAYKN